MHTERALVTGPMDLRDQIRNLIDEVIRAQVAAAARDRLNVDQPWRALRGLSPICISPHTIAAPVRLAGRG